MENRISPSSLIVWILLALVVGALIGYFIPRTSDEGNPSNNINIGQNGNPAGNNVPNDNPPATGTISTRVGEYVCLPHRNANGPTTLECAFGLRTPDGLYYGLNMQDLPSDMPGSLNTGQNVRVDGRIDTTAESNIIMERYAVVGVMRVTSIVQIP
ncbi:MAG TPA: hypothetical protein VFQ59_02425 [Candidatus Paceibacterota bacterium]|nr:hypothetical protein [Candidatus Paceibacterota bacterium]